MFDKFKARIKKLEEDHESIHKAKLHVEKYQLAYVAVGSSALTVVLVRTFGGPQVIVQEAANLPSVINNTVAPAIAPVIAPVITNNHIVIAALGDPGNVVECVETGVKYASQGQLARTIGESATNVANHLHGKLPDLHGLHYQVIGKAGHPLA